MKTKKFMTALTAAFITMTSVCAFATPPADIKATLDADGSVTITASHKVNDRSKHYVMAMIISEGGEQLLVKKYDEQQSNDGFKDSVKLDGVKAGDVITIELSCNIMGSAKTSLTI